MSKVEYSVVVPVYNSEKSLEELFYLIDATFAKIQKSYEVVFVDDDSHDGSWRILNELKIKYPYKIHAIKLSKNFGQHCALLCGFNFANGKYIFTLDDDIQTPPEEMIKLINKMEATDADVVYGIYKEKKHSAIRNFGSWVVERIFEYFANTPGKGSSFKLIKFDIVNKVRSQNLKYIYIDEIIAWYTNNIMFEYVQHNPRREGESGYSSWKLAVLTIKLIVNYTVLPLRLMTYFGFLSSLISLIVGIYFIYQKLNYGAELGFTALIVAIFYSSGIILFCLGILGEYISRLYITQNNKPPYFIKSII